MKNHQCHPCLSQPRAFESSNSSPKDVILLYYFHTLSGLELLVRSARSAKCHASIIVQLDTACFNVSQNGNLKKLADDCGISFIGYKFPTISWGCTYIFKLFIRLDFLGSQYGQFFERVAFVDGFDS